MSPPHEQSSPDRVNAVYTRLPHTDQWPLGTFCFQGGGRVLDRAEERTGSDGHKAARGGFANTL